MSGLLVFDLDGTLVDSSRDLATATNAALRRVAPDAPAVPLEKVRTFVGNGAGVLIQKSLRHAGIDRPVGDVLPVFLECYEECLLDTTVPYPGIPAALDALQGVRRAVLTNKPGPLARKLLKGLGLARHFDRVWGAGDVDARKPDPAGLLQLVAELEATPGDTWLIGDSPVDVRTGRAAGVQVAGVTWGLAPAELLREAPDRLIETAGDLAALGTE
jgi:phosphoglycolate phosphatase